MTRSWATTSVACRPEPVVIWGGFGPAAGADLELLLYTSRIQIVPFDHAQSTLAVRAWKRYGKGRHPAALNLGDCCVYALAKASGEPVLCKGGDFAQTDIAVVPVG